MSGPVKHSILIVEDEGIVGEDLRQMLLEMGYDAFAVAASADEALAEASKRCPDIVLMDIRIKGKLDGVETAAVLSERFGVPVVYLTAHADDGTIDRAKRTRPYGYVLKPVRAAELRSVIEVSLFRREMEQRAREREQWFATTLRSVADAIISVDLAGCVTFMNPAAEKLTGLALADVAGKHAHDVLRLIDDLQQPMVGTPLDRALSEGRAVVFDGTMETTRGRISIADSAAPVIDDNVVLGAVMVFRDTTRQRQMQRQLELADRLASLGTMAAGVAHEINNPLAVVMSDAEFLAENLHDLMSTSSPDVAASLADGVAVLREITLAAQRIARIVSDLKAFSRPPEDHAPTDANLGRAIAWAVRTAAHETRHRARVTVDVPADLPHAQGDEGRIGQVFVNLLFNAAQAIDVGAPEKNEIRVVAARASDKTISVEVHDTGSGMSEDVTKRIFEPFFTTKEVGVGTGLGLSICHGIVTSLGGTIDATSTPGKGTTMRVLLPVAAEKVRVHVAAAVAAGRAKARILLIDDEPAILQALQRVLKAQHDVTAVSRANDALTCLENGDVFDVILCDVMMPDMTGPQFYEALLATRTEMARRVVFITGAVTEGAGALQRSLPNATIEKPFQTEAVRAAIAHVMETLGPTELLLRPDGPG